MSNAERARNLITPILARVEDGDLSTGVGASEIVRTLAEHDLLSYLDVEAGICTCGNRFDGDNLCTVSACEREF